MKAASVFALFVAGVVAVSLPAVAQGNTSKSVHLHKKMHARKSVHKETAAPEPSVAGKLPTDFNCELGDKLTIYRSPGDSQHIDLRWRKHLHEMTRVVTTTGAERFENAADGLVWIGIPAKSMLLDSKHGHQLANECRDAAQEATLHQEEQLARVRH